MRDACLDLRNLNDFDALAILAVVRALERLAAMQKVLWRILAYFEVGWRNYVGWLLLGAEVLLRGKVKKIGLLCVEGREGRFRSSMSAKSSFRLKPAIKWMMYDADDGGSRCR
jgi:hypothetical protein